MISRNPAYCAWRTRAYGPLVAKRSCGGSLGQHPPRRGDQPEPATDEGVAGQLERA